MLDRFHLIHHRIVFRGDSRGEIREQGFSRAERLAKADIPLPDRSLIMGSCSVGENISLYGLASRRAIKEHLGSVWRQPDDLLLEFVILSKWLQKLADADEPELMTARAALGTMIQRGLTQLLCDIDLSQWWRLHRFGRTDGLSKRQWEINMAGASAAAYVLMALASRERRSCTCRPPTRTSCSASTFCGSSMACATP